MCKNSHGQSNYDFFSKHTASIQTVLKLIVYIIGLYSSQYSIHPHHFISILTIFKFKPYKQICCYHYDFFLFDLLYFKMLVFKVQWYPVLQTFKLVYHGNLSKHHIMFISMSIAHFNYVSQLFTYNPKIIYFIYNICKIVFIKLHIFFFTLMVIYFQIFNRTYRTLKFHV